MKSIAIKHLSDKSRFLATIMLVMAIIYLVFPKNISSAEASVTIGSLTFEVGKTYKAVYSAYFPGNAISSGLNDFKGNPIDVTKPSCVAPRGIPYGTKLRIFNTSTARDSTICVVNNYSSTAIVADNGSINIELIMPTAESAAQWSKINGQVIIVSVGDNNSLDYTDGGEFPVAGTVEEPESPFSSQEDQEITEEFLIKQDIRFFDDNECITDSNSGLTDAVLGAGAENEKVEYILRFLTGVGFTLNQSAGIVGNLQAESGNNISPVCLEKSSGLAADAPAECDQKSFRCNTTKNVLSSATGKYICEPKEFTFNSGIGIAQWTGGRQSALQKIANNRGTHVYDLNTQLETLLYDLAKVRTRCFQDNAAQYANKVPNKAINKANTVEEATFAFLDCFENPGKANNCGYGAYIRQDRLCDGERVTAEVAEATYQAYLKGGNNRVYRAIKIANTYRGKIQDGAGVTRDALLARFGLEGGGDLPPGEAPAAIDVCAPAQQKFDGPAGALQELVSKSAWPLDCCNKMDNGRAALNSSTLTTADKKHIQNNLDFQIQNNIDCGANGAKRKNPTEFYANLVKCRTGGGGECKNTSGYIGGCNGKDCGGFVTTMIQESGWDPNYNSKKGTVSGGQLPYLQSSSEWELIYPANTGSPRDITQDLLPGDVAISAEKGHTFLFTGQIAGFQYPAASASYAECDPYLYRAPMAAHEMLEASQYNWYRKKSGNNQTGG